MIKVGFNPAELSGARLDEWNAWHSKAEKAIDEVIDTWEVWKADPGRKPKDKFEITWKSGIWSELKAWLKTYFFADKCAYCETLIGRFVGDAEHYRPKGRVSVKTDDKFVRATVTDIQGNRIEHPGYFWLAYDWQNLLPSCERCNKLQGKLDQFPLGKGKVHLMAVKLTPDEAKRCRNPHPSKQWPGWYYLRSEDLNDREQPMLLHPYFDDPHEHIQFGYAGIVAAADDRGATLIDVCNLADSTLLLQRQMAQENAEARWHSGYFGAKPIDQAIQDGRRAIDSYVKGTAPFSAAARDWLRAKYPTCGL